MACVACEDELIVVTLGCECARHVLVRKDPVVHVVAHGVRVEQVVVAYFHPDAYRLGGRVRDEVLRELKGAVRGLWVVRPLLVDVGAGVGENTVVELGMVPGHNHGAGTAGAAAHGCSGVGIAGEFDVVFGFDLRDDLGLNELGVAA